MQRTRDQVIKLYRRFFHAIFFLMAFLMIYAFYPKQGRFKYEYQKGKPWLQEALIASFDFPIMKSKEALDQERDSLLHQYVPFLNYDVSAVDRQLLQLNTAIDQWLEKETASLSEKESRDIKVFLNDLFASLYQNGILSNAIESYELLRGKKEVNRVADKIAEKIPSEQLLSLKTAYLKASSLISEKAITNKSFLLIQQNIDLNQYFEANLELDQAMNDSRIAEMVSSIPLSRGVVQAGTRIISQGEMVNSDNFMILESYNKAYAKTLAHGGWFSPIMLGNMLLVLSLMFLLVLYIQSFNRSIFERKRNYTMILSIIVLFFVISKLIYDNPNLSIYIIPFTILPIIIRTFVGARMAIFIHFILLLMVSNMAENSLEFVFVQFVAGTVAVISLSKLHRRGNLIYAALLIAASYVIISVGFLISKNGTISLADLVSLRWIIISSFLVLIAYLVIYVIEKIFGFVSDVTLMELSDTNNPLLRKLAEEAPGTFQHSMQVANLAEAVVVQTSGNAMLIRAGALYHDVGKIASSQYFIENQVLGQNPHEKLDHFQSARKIINHVADGVELAKKYKLPESIVEFIRMHHGTSMARYFYLKYKEENPGKEVKEEDFQYPGPNPQSRETAILMLADGVEAAARSLPEKNEESLRRIIDQIIDAKVQHRELDDAPITFRDIKVIKAIFLEKLKNIYHVRIQYPKEK